MRSLLIAVITLLAVMAQANERPLVRLDRILSSAESLDSSSLSDSIRPAIEAMARIGIIESDTQQAVRDYVNGRAFTFFEPEITARLDSLNLSDTISSTIHTLEALLPDMQTPGHIYGIITPYSQAVMNVDSVMLIGLNHYLGHDYEAYRYFEPYIRRQKDARLMPYHVAESLIQQSYPMRADSTASALIHILRDGAVTATLMEAVPDASLSCAGSWTDDELSWLRTHEAELWDDMTDRKMLESTDSRLIANLLAPSPATIMFGNHAPGRTGRYIGYRLIQAYLDHHPDTPMSSLLSPDFLQQHSQDFINEYTVERKSR